MEPNTTPPILMGHEAIAYRDKARKATQDIPEAREFQPVPVMQITEQTTPAMVREAAGLGVEVFKVYPRWVTTNSENGVENYENIYPALAELQELRRMTPREPLVGLHEIVVQFHAETPRFEVEGLYKEEAFLSNEMGGISKEFPELPVTIEHVSSKFGVDWVREQPARRKIGAGITIQHLTNTQDDVLGYSARSKGLMRVHDGFKPQAKLQRDRLAICTAALSGNSHFLYADDGAWHFKKNKEWCGASCGAANTLAALPRTIQLFEEANALDKLEPFLSEYGARFYGYPRNKGTVTLVRMLREIPLELDVPGADDTVVPWRFGEVVQWQIAD